MRVSQISDGIQKIRLGHVDDIAYLCFLRILLRNFLIRYTSIKIAIIPKQIGCHFSTSFPIDRRHQYGRFTQMIEYPSAYSFLILIFLKSVVYPQTERNGPTKRTTTQNSIVWSVCQSGFHFCQSSNTSQSLVFVHHLQLINTRIKDFTFREILGSRTCCKKSTYQCHPERSEGSR